MGSHVGAIGMPLSVGLSEAISGVMAHAERLGGTADNRVEVYAYQDPSGSRATVTLEDRRVVCFTPTFAPATHLAVTIGSLADDDCPYERPLLVQVLGRDGAEHPLAVVIEDLGVTEPKAGTHDALLEVVALAEQLTIFADEAAYRASGTPMAVESLIPSGLFAPGVIEPGEGQDVQVAPRMIMSGVVTASELRHHGVFGLPFVVCRIRSYGAEWTACLDAVDLGGAESLQLPTVGSIVAGTFYVSGRLVRPPGARS